MLIGEETLTAALAFLQLMGVKRLKTAHRVYSLVQLKGVKWRTAMAVQPLVKGEQLRTAVAE